MAKIETYILATQPLSFSDMLIGTEVDGPIPNATKNFSLGELYNLFASLPAVGNLQQTLDAGNTATQNIFLSGGITSTTIKPQYIIDMLSSTGNVGEVLIRAVSGISWGPIPTPSPNLQQVTDIGNVTTNNIQVTDDIRIRNSFNNTIGRIIAQGEITANRSYTLPDATGRLPLSVNNQTADAFGNITIAAGGGTNPTDTYIPYNDNGTFEDSHFRQYQNVFGTDILETQFSGNVWGLKIQNNNTSLDSNKIQLGNIIGAGDGNGLVMYPSTIDLNNRGYSLFDYDIQGGITLSNYNIDLSHKGTSYTVDGNNQIIKTFSLGVDNGLKLEFLQNNYWFGDYSSTGGGAYISINSVANILSTTSPITYINSDTVQIILGTDLTTTDTLNNVLGLNLNVSSNFYKLGNNSTGVSVDLANQIYQFGDYDFGGANGTNIFIDDTNSIIKTRYNGASTDKGLYLDFTNNQYYLGDTNYFVKVDTSIPNTTISTLSGTGTRMVVADASGILSTQTIPSGGSSPLIAKGDLYTYSTADTRLPLGLDTQVLLADRTTATGLKWGTNTAPTPTGYYGAWQDDQTQTAAASNVGYPMIFRTTDLSNGVTMVSDGTNLTRITFANTGIYNIQFSVQIQNVDNAEHDVTIWLRKDGTDVTGSAGFVQAPKRRAAGTGNEGHVITGWNYLLSVVAGEYYQIVWSTTSSANVTLQYYAAGSPPPSTASTLVTVTQQSGIMAGTGITRGIYTVSTNTTAGSGANVDYVYLVSNATILTLPTAVGNTNTYTVKRVGTSTVSIATTSSQTIDGSASPITINVQYVSLTFVSDGSNWNII